LNQKTGSKHPPFHLTRLCLRWDMPCESLTKSKDQTWLDRCSFSNFVTEKIAGWVDACHMTCHMFFIILNYRTSPLRKSQKLFLSLV
jgi:hypothetical protein